METIIQTNNLPDHLKPYVTKSFDDLYICDLPEDIREALANDPTVTIEDNNDIEICCN